MDALVIACVTEANRTIQHKKRFTFQVNCQGIVRTVTVAADSREAAGQKVESMNPGCEIRFLWAHD